MALAAAKSGARTGSARARVGAPAVTEIQRARVIVAMTEAAARQGVANVTVADIVTRASVSRRTFYELFDSREESFIAAFDEAVETARSQVAAACAGREKWLEAMRAAVYALLALLDARPELARILVVESLSAGPRAVAHRRQVLAELATLVDGGRGEAKASEAAYSQLTAEGVVGGALSLVHARICAESKRPLVELGGALMGMIVLPYLGARASRRELDRPAPKRRSPLPPPARALRALPLRLTYRTVRTLQAIAEHPDASNRQVGRAAGIEDQGQASKLLVRLERVKMIVNTRDSHVRGAANAWRLTDEGAALLQLAARSNDVERRQGARGDGS